MDCSRFLEILADYFEGKLSAGEHSAAETHLAGCSACKRLVDISNGSVDLLPNDGDLTRLILDRTSGSVCSRVDSNLWDFVEGVLDAADSQLTALHLDHCTACRSRAGAIAEFREAIPSMAEIDPGESFTRAVLRATSGSRVCSPAFRTRFSAWWERVVRRPRFTLEAAYLGTLILLFLFNSPVLPFKNMDAGRIYSAAIEPSATYLRTIWADARSPVVYRLSGFTSAAALKKQAASEALSGLAKDGKHVSVSTLAKIEIWGKYGKAVIQKQISRLVSSPET